MGMRVKSIEGCARLHNLHDCLSGGCGNVGCEHAVGTVGGCRDVACHTVDIGGNDGAYLGFVALCHEGGDDAGEDIAAAGGGKGGSAGGVEVDFAVGTDEGGVAAFEEDEDIVVARHLESLDETSLVGGVLAEQAVELTGVGC